MATKKTTQAQAIAALAVLSAYIGGTDKKEEAAPAPTLPLPKAIAKLAPADLTELAKQYGIEGKPAALKKLLTTLSIIVNETSDDIEEAQISALAEALGVDEGKTSEKTAAAIAKFAATVGASEESEEESEDAEESEEESEEDADEEESEDSDDEEESEDEDSDDDESEDEEDADEEDSDDDESEDSDDDESEDEESEEESDEDSDEEESEDDESEDEDEEDAEEESEEEEVSAKDQKSRLAAYNKAAKKPLKSYDALAKLLDGNTWGEAYVKDGEGYCCGLPLKEVKGHEDQGVCAVTGTKWKFDSDEETFSQMKSKK